MLLVAVAKQVLVATAVALAIGLFFLVFGFLVIGSDLVKVWTLHRARVVDVARVGPAACAQ